MTKKMKTVGIVLAVLLIGSMFFTGCDNDDRVTLRVLYYLEASAPNAVQDANSWMATFEANNPGVKVDRENLFSEPFHDKLRSYAAAGDLPDVFYAWPSGRSDYLHDQRLMKDLTPFINRDGLRPYYSPAALDPAGQQAGYMGIFPQGITATHAFFVNLEVLQAVGLQPARTYAELVQQVPILRAAGYQTVMIPAQDDWVMQSCLFSMVLGRFAGADWSERIHGGRAKFTDPDFVAAFDFMRQLYADGVIHRDNMGVGYGEGPGMFANNRGAYYIDGDWRVGAFITDSSTGQALISPARQNNIRITVFPDIPGTKINGSSSVVLGTGYAMAASIPAGSKREEAAWQFIKYMLGYEVSQLRTERGGTPNPSRIDLNFDAMNLEPIQKAMGGLANEIRYATPVIDAVMPSEVFLPINIALFELGMGTRTGAQVAADIQRAYDNWK